MLNNPQNGGWNARICFQAGVQFSAHFYIWLKNSLPDRARAFHRFVIIRQKSKFFNFDFSKT